MQMISTRNFAIVVSDTRGSLCAARAYCTLPACAETRKLIRYDQSDLKEQRNRSDGVLHHSLYELTVEF